MKNSPNPSFSRLRLMIKAPQSLLPAALLCAALLGSPSAHAGTGTWTNSAGGTWDTGGNWANGNVADGAGFAGLFNTLSLSAPVVVDLNSSHTLGSLSFSGGNSTNTWTISSSNSSILTLKGSTIPTIAVGSDTIISTQLAGTQGFTKSGSGMLVISGPASIFGGTVTVSAGTLNVRASSTNSALNNATVTMLGGTFQIGTSGGAAAAIGGLNSTGGAGSVSAAAAQFLIIRGVSGDYSYSGTMNRGSWEVMLGGGGSQTITQNLNYTGVTTVNSGRFISTTAAATGNPFSTGAVRLGNSSGSTTGTGTGAGGLVINSSAASGAVALTGANTAAATAFTYNNGSQLMLNKGSASSLSYTVGNASATTNSVLVRVSAAVSGVSDQGTLVITPASGLSNFGTATGEKFIVNGGVATTAINSGTGGGTMASSSIIGKDTDGSGAFLTYDATDGFKLATASTSTDINGGTAFSDTRLFNATTTQTLSGNTGVYALQVQGAAINLGSNTLSIGDATAGSAAGVILNGGSINGGTLAFSTDAAGVIYTSGTASISSNIQNITSGTSGRGVTFAGPGELTLTGTNNFRGGMFVNDSTVSVSNNTQLGVVSTNTSVGSVTLRGATMKVTDDMTITNRELIMNNGVNAGGGTFDVAATKTLTVTNGTNNAKLISGNSSLTKSGAGTMTMQGGLSNTYTGKTTVSAGTLVLNMNSGFTAISSAGATGVNADATDLQIKTTGTLQWNASNQVVDTAKVALSGGVMNLNGQSEGSTLAAGLGNLSLSVTSTIDFGLSGGDSIIRFSGLDTHTASTVLNIINWSGTSFTGGGSDRLLFSGLASDFFAQYAQNEVTFNGSSGYAVAQFSGYYEVTVPEPSTYALIAAAGVILMVCRRRSRAVR